MAGNLHAFAGLRYNDRVYIQNIRKLTGQATQLNLQCGVFTATRFGLNGAAFTFNVGQDGINFGNVGAGFGFDAGDQRVGLAQTQGFGDFQMLFQMELPIVVLDA